MQQFRIRPSACSQIMGSLKAGSITQKQHEQIKMLEDKEKVTAKQQETLDGLIVKRDAPAELGTGAKSYCEQWLKEQLYNRREEISSKYLTRGNESEDDSIELIGKYIGNPTLLKYDGPPLENTYIIGTPDVIESDIVYDAKSSWSFSTFPLFEDKLDLAYYWQGMAYMDLTGVKKFETVYCLVDLPEELLETEIKKLTWGGMDAEEAEAKMRAFHSYGDLPLNLRVKAFPVEYNHHEVNKIYRRVEICRLYIKELIEGMR